MTTIEQQNGSGRRLPGAARAATFAEPVATPPVSHPPAVSPPAKPAPAPTVDSPPTDARPDGAPNDGLEVPAARSAEPVDQAADVLSPPATAKAAPAPVLDAAWFQVPKAPAPRVAASTALVTWEPAPLDETPATWGRRQAVIRALSFGLVKPRPGAEELAHRENERVIRSAAWARSVRVAVANPKGGSGKTPTALMLGGAMARVRGGSVAVWDAADAPGTLHVLAEGTARRCVAEIAADPEGYAYPGTIAAVAVTQSTGADALVSLSDREFDRSSTARIQWALDRTHRVSVADTGNVPHAGAFTQLIETADILVVPTVIQQASVDSALRLLHRLQASRELVQRAVVAILHTGGPQTPGLASAIDQLFQDAGVEAIEHIPFDRHIAAGSTITYDRLSRPSQLAWTRLATATVANITTA